MEPKEAPGNPQRAFTRTDRRVGGVFAVVVVLGLVGGILHWVGLGSYLAQRREYAGRTQTFSGGSGSLKQTVIVPTLDTPCPTGRNVIWCSSFQLAWNEIRDNVVGGPLDLPDAADVAARLNAAEQSGLDLDPGSFYAAGGWVDKGIRERIRKEMAHRFPSHALPDLSNYHSGILSYAYLRANAPFKHPFRQLDKGLAFTDSDGMKTEVAGFGAWDTFLRQYRDIGEQMEILALRSEDPDNPWEPNEYVIDLCRDSRPCQVVVARVELSESLAETLEYIRRQTEEFKKQSHHEEASRFQKNDFLSVPEMFWRIDHRFNDLIGKMVKNVGMPIVEALQTIEFRLDRSGAMLESESNVAIASSPRDFLFNRPFLVYMQKRGAEHPFFVMWVDNAELLTRKAR